jgi:hypothetical protein
MLDSHPNPFGEWLFDFVQSSAMHDTFPEPNNIIISP